MIWRKEKIYIDIMTISVKKSYLKCVFQITTISGLRNVQNFSLTVFETFAISLN